MSIFTMLADPIERYFWIAVVAVAIGCGVYEREHLIHEGEQKIEIAEAAHAKIVAAKDQKIKAAAQAAANKVSEDYEAAVSRPPIADTGLVCRDTAAPDHTAPADNRPGDTVQTAPRTDDVFDPSGALLTDSRAADDQINALISTVEILEKYINDIRTVK